MENCTVMEGLAAAAGGQEIRMQIVSWSAMVSWPDAWPPTLSSALDSLSFINIYHLKSKSTTLLSKTLKLICPSMLCYFFLFSRKCYNSKTFVVKL